MGSDHAPLYCDLHKRWKAKKEELEKFYLKLYDRTRTISGMFHNTLAVKTLPKAIKKDEIEMKQDQQWQSVSKPEEFPNELREYVHPDQREITVVRFNKFKDRKHLEKCIEKIVKQLDIQHREDDKYHCEWIERDVSSHQMFLAQAVSNVDAYFFPDPEEVSMAKDVVANG